MIFSQNHREIGLNSWRKNYKDLPLISDFRLTGYAPLKALLPCFSLCAQAPTVLYISLPNFCYHIMVFRVWHFQFLVTQGVRSRSMVKVIFYIFRNIIPNFGYRIIGIMKRHRQFLETKSQRLSW